MNDKNVMDANPDTRREENEAADQHEPMPETKSGLGQQQESQRLPGHQAEKAEVAVEPAVEQAQAQMPSPTAQEPSPVPVEAEPDPEASPPACEVRYRRNDQGGFDLWVGEGCSKEDLAAISKGKAQVDNVDLECAEKWEQKYGAKAEPGSDADQKGDASLSCAGEPILTRMVVTRKEQFDIPPEIPVEEAPTKAKAKKGRK